MPDSALQLDYGNVLTAAVGPAHGLSPAEIGRAEPAVKNVVTRIER